MRRREFIALLGGATAWPLATHAQQREQMRRIGILLPATADDAVWQARLGAFLQGLGLLGWTIGRNLSIDAATGNPSRMSSSSKSSGESVRINPSRNCHDPAVNKFD